MKTTFAFLFLQLQQTQRQAAIEVESARRYNRAAQRTIYVEQPSRHTRRKLVKLTTLAKRAVAKRGIRKGESQENANVKTQP